MPRFEADFATWLTSSPTVSSGVTQWLWNDFWLRDYLENPVEELDFDITAELVGDLVGDGERTGNEPDDPPEDDDDPTEPEVEDDPEPEEDPVDDGRDDPVEDPEDDPEDEPEDEPEDDPEDDPQDDPEDEPEDDDEDTGGGDDPDPSDPDDTAEDGGTSGYVTVPSGPFPGFFDPLGHFLSLFSDRFGGLDVAGLMTSGAGQTTAPAPDDAFEDEFVFLPTDPDPVTPSLDDLALSDLLPEDSDGMAPQLPVDDWFF